MTRVLIVDDEESICWGLARLCEQLGYESATASSAERGIELASESGFDLVITDIRLPGMDGIAALATFRQLLGDVPVITITAFGDLQTAIDAIQKGAFEYIVKPFELAHVRSKIQQAVAVKHLVEREGRIDRLSEIASRQSGMIGSSPLMQEVFKQIALTTTSDSAVLITGESGTGKELAARSIHAFGARSQGPFITANLGTFDPALAEAELFGHFRESYDGDDKLRPGLMSRAQGGTLFLDEVAELPPGIQVRLSRALDLGEFTPVGATEPIRIDFRIISSTSQDLLAQINHGEFRSDLYYRLRALEIRLPPLRQRTEDIAELVEYFLQKSDAGDGLVATTGFIDALKSRAWPGNIRELESVIARAVTVARSGPLTPEHIENQPEPAHSITTTAPGDVEANILELVSQWTREHWNDSSDVPLYERLISVIDPAILSTAFQLSDHQYSAAARKLGIHRTTLKKKLDEDSN